MRENLVSKINLIEAKAMRYARPVSMATSTVMASVFGCIACAEGEPSELMTAIIKIMAALVIALAVILLVMGIIHYASAHSEGDGPAKSKAVGQLAAAVMLITVSIILTSNAEKLAGFISADVEI